MELIVDEVWKTQPSVPDAIIKLLTGLEAIDIGFPVNQLQHCLQTADRAAKANESDEVVAAALCHDMGKSISVFGHEHIAASILKPYVSEETYWIVENHQIIQGRSFMQYFGVDPTVPSEVSNHPFYEHARVFVDEYDAPAFLENADVPPLEHYLPLIQEMFSKPRGFSR